MIILRVLAVYGAVTTSGLLGRLEPGYICGFTSDTGVNPYYVPLDATPATVNPMYYYDGASCVASGATWTLYQMVPNDPVVTGFQNTYTEPFYPVVTLPTAP